MASSKIKGITIEIGGETTKLGKALEEVEKSSKSLQSELKGVNSLLKLDPSNVELLKQKQELLTKSIESTEDKLKTLNSTMAKIKSGEIEATDEQFRDLQREIVLTETKLDSLKKQSKEFGSVMEQQVKAASEKVKELGSNIEDTGKKMGGLSTGAAAGLTVAITSAASLEDAVNKYLGATGKSIEETEKYQKVLQSIHNNNYGADYADIAEKMRIVSNILGDLPDSELQSVVEKSYLLEEAYGMDFQENIRGVNALMDQFGITSEQAYELINQGAQKGLNQNQDLTDQIAEYSTYYAKLGFTAEEFFNIMIAGSKDGAYQIDYLNDAMKEFGIRTKDNSTGTVSALQSLGLNADEIMNKFAKGGESAQEAFGEVTKSLMDLEDPVKRNELGVQLFGTKWEDLEESAVQAMTTASNEVDMLGNTVDQTSETMYGGTANKAKKALRSIQNSFTKLGDVILPIIAPIAETIATLATKFSQLNPTIRTIIVVVLSLVAALSPVLIVIAKVVTAVSTLMPVFGAIATFVSGTLIPTITAVVTALGWPVIAITAIIGAIVLLWNNCEWFREMVKALWEGIKAGFQAAIEWISAALNSIGEFFAGLWAGIKQVSSVVGDWFRNIFTSAWNGITNAWNGVGNFFGGVWNGIKNAFGNVTNWFKTTFSKAWTAVKNVFSTGGKIFDGIKEGIADVFTTVVNAIITGINKVIAVPFNAINATLNKIRNTTIPLIDVKPFEGLWKKDPIAVPEIPLLNVGTNFVPTDDMPAILHKGEQVIPAKYNPAIDNTHMKNAMFDALTDFTNIRSQSNSEIGTLTTLLNKYMPEIIDGMGRGVYLDGRTLVGKLTPEIDAQLGSLANKRRRGM